MKAETEFPDKDKMYLSPSKESIMLYVEGKWQNFIREDKVQERLSLLQEQKEEKECSHKLTTWEPMVQKYRCAQCLKWL